MRKFISYYMGGAMFGYAGYLFSCIRIGELNTPRLCIIISLLIYAGIYCLVESTK